MKLNEESPRSKSKVLPVKCKNFCPRRKKKFFENFLSFFSPKNYIKAKRNTKPDKDHTKRTLPHPHVDETKKIIRHKEIPRQVSPSSGQRQCIFYYRNEMRKSSCDGTLQLFVLKGEINKKKTF